MFPAANGSGTVTLYRDTCADLLAGEDVAIDGYAAVVDDVRRITYTVRASGTDVFGDGHTTATIQIGMDTCVGLYDRLDTMPATARELLGYVRIRRR